MRELFPQAEIDRLLKSSFFFRGSARDLQYSTDMEVILTGPAGTGKTLAGLWKMYKYARSVPGFRGALVRQTKSSLAQSALVTFESDILGPSHPLVVNGPKRASRQEYIFPSGGEIVVTGLDKSSKLLSASYDLIYVVQAEEILQADWEIMMTRLRNWVLPYQQIYGDCNPSHPRHWIKQRADSGALKLWNTVHKDNPAMYDTNKGEWTQAGLDYIATLDAMTGARKKRLRYGIWASAEGVIFSVYDEDRHKVEAFNPPSVWPRVVGIDPVGDRIAAVWLAYDPSDEILHAYREYVQPFGETTPEHVQNILKLSRGETIWAWAGGGPSERQARVDWATAGIPLVAPENKSVWSAIDKIIQLFDSDRLVIHDCCTELLSDVGDYRRKIVRGIATDTIEEKEKYHACLVAGTMVLTQRGNVPIEDVQVGDLAMTRDGWRPVTDAAMTDASAQTQTVLFSNGATLTGTADHPVFVRGWGHVELQALCRGDTAETLGAPIYVAVSSAQNDRQAQPVYNLTVADKHEYYANGVLVGNCDALRYAVAFISEGQTTQVIRPAPRASRGY